MKCPKCGYERHTKDNQFVPATECPSCGIVYVKTNHAPSNGANGDGSHLKRSAVDAHSLKKAKERVELRLRKQLESQQKDERHALTLERAKRITRLEAEKRKQRPAQKRVDQTRSDKNEYQLGEARMEEEPVLDLVYVVDNQSRTHGSSYPETRPVASAAAPEDAAEARLTDHGASSAITDDRTQPEKRSHKAGTLVHDTTPADEDTKEKITAPCSRRTNAALNQNETDFAEETAYEEQFAARRRGATSSPAGISRFLPLVAGLILLVGVTGAVLSWTTITSVEANTAARQAHLSGLPLGLLLGFAYLATGVLGFAFFWVASLISRQLKDIQRLLRAQTAQLSRLHEEQEDGEDLPA